MNAFWNYHYKDHLIEIKNSTAHTELYVDGVQIDRKEGFFAVELVARLPDGENLIVEVKAGFIPKCLVKVNGVVLEAEHS